MANFEDFLKTNFDFDEKTSKDALISRIKDLKKIRHDMTVKEIVNLNPGCEELNVEDMEFRDFYDSERDLNIELTFSKNINKKLQKGIPKKCILLISNSHVEMNQFDPYKMSDFFLKILNEFNEKLEKLILFTESKFGKLGDIHKPNLIYKLPDISNFFDNPFPKLTTSKFNSDEKKCIELLKKEIEKIAIERNFFRSKYKKIKDISFDEMFDTFTLDNFPPHKKRTSSLYFPFPSTTANGNLSFILDVLKDDPFISDLRSNQEKLEKDFPENKIVSNKHMDSAKINFLKKKKRFKEMEVPIQTSHKFEEDCSCIDRYITQMEVDFTQEVKVKGMSPCVNILQAPSDPNSKLIHDLSCKLENLEFADYLKFVERISIDILHQQRPTKMNEVYLSKINDVTFVVYGHGTKNVDRKYTRPFKVIGIRKNNHLDDLFSLEHDEYIGKDQSIYSTKWMRLPIPYIEHWFSAYERVLASTILNNVSILNRENSCKDIVSEFVIKGLICCNTKKKLQNDLDNFKYLMMGLTSYKSDVKGMIEDKMNTPVKDLLQLYIRKKLRENMYKIKEFSFRLLDPKFKGNIRLSQTRGGDMIGDHIFFRGKIQNFGMFLDHCYLSHLTSKDASSSYHDKIKSLVGMAEWEMRYDEERVNEDSFDKIINLIYNPEKMNFSPMVVRICGKLISQKLHKTDCKEVLDSLRADNSISVISNTNSMVYQRFKNETETDGYNFKKKNFEIRKRVHDVIVQSMRLGETKIEDFLIKKDYIPYFNMTNKVQFGGPREIYIQDLITRIKNYWVELNYQIISTYLKEEGITKSGIRKSIILNSIVDDCSYSGDYYFFENRDATKWSLGATLDEFLYFTQGLSSLFNKSNYDLIIHSIMAMKNKIVEIPYDVWKIWKRSYFDKSKLNENLLFIYERSSENKLLILRSNFMMGIFNYMSSVKHVSKMYLCKLLILDMDIVKSVDHLEHSDDEFIAFIIKKGTSIEQIQFKIDLIDEIIEICGSLTNIKTNYKKSNVHGFIAEFCSCFNLNGDYLEPKINFLTSIFQPTSLKGWKLDMDEISGRIREYVQRCGYFCEIPLLVNFMNNKLNRIYRMNKINWQELFGLNQNEIPYYIGGTLRVDPILFQMIGPRSQVFVNMKNNTYKRIMSFLSSFNGESDELDIKIRYMKFLHFYGKMENEGEKLYLPKVKSPALEIERMQNMYNFDSFLTTYFKQPTIKSLVKVASFMTKDLVSNDIDAISSTQEFSFWRGKLGYMKKRSCTIKDYLEKISKEIKTIEPKFDLSSFLNAKQIQLTKLLFNLNFIRFLECPSSRFLPNKIKVFENPFKTVNSLEILGLRYYLPEKFEKIDQSLLEVNWNSMKSDMNEAKPLFEKCTDWNEYIMTVRNLSDQQITLRCKPSSKLNEALIDYIGNFYSELRLEIKNAKKTEIELDSRFQRMLKINDRDLEDKVDFLISAYSVGKILDLDFRSLIRKTTIDMNYMLNLNFKDFVKSRINSKKIKQISYIFASEFSNFELIKGCFSTFFTHEWIKVSREESVLEVWFLDNFMRIIGVGKKCRLEMDLRNISYLPQSLYAAETLWKGGKLRFDDISNSCNYKSFFCRPNDKKDRIKFTGLYYTLVLRDTKYSLQMKSINVKPKFQIKQNNTYSLESNFISINGVKCFKFTPSINPIESNYLMGNFVLNGVDLSEYLSPEFLNAYASQRFVNVKTPLRSQWRQLKEEREEVSKRLVDFICDCRLAYYVERNLNVLKMSNKLKVFFKIALYEADDIRDDPKVVARMEAEEKRKNEILDFIKSKFEDATLDEYEYFLKIDKDFNYFFDKFSEYKEDYVKRKQDIIDGKIKIEDDKFVKIIAIEEEEIIEEEYNDDDDFGWGDYGEPELTDPISEPKGKEIEKGEEGDEEEDLDWDFYGDPEIDDYGETQIETEINSDLLLRLSFFDITSGNLKIIDEKMSEMRSHYISQVEDFEIGVTKDQFEKFCKKCYMESLKTNLKWPNNWEDAVKMLFERMEMTDRQVIEIDYILNCIKTWKKPVWLLEDKDFSDEEFDMRIKKQFKETPVKNFTRRKFK